MLSAMVPWSVFLTEHQHGAMRWTLGAKELLYRNRLLADFFRRSGARTVRSPTHPLHRRTSFF